MNKILLLLLTVCLSICSRAQYLETLQLSKKGNQKGILHIYSGGNFEVINQLTLYKDKSFYYQYKNLAYDLFSRGKWTRKNDVFILNSEVDSNDVSVKFVFFNTDTLKTYYDRTLYKDSLPAVYNTKFQVPINLKAQPLLDAIIYINKEANYCFPFFDTCIGNNDKIQRVKVNFSNGFKSKWLPINVSDFKRCLCIAQVDFLFTNYVSYKNYKLRIIGNRIKHL